MDMRVELQQLREVMPEYAIEEYWNISYGRCVEDGEKSGRKISTASRKVSAMSRSSTGGSAANIPLPDVPPDQSSPILGISMPNRAKLR